MKHLQDKKDDTFGRQFSKYVEAGIGADDLEELYSKVHKAIRADPLKARDGKELGHHKIRAKAKDPKEVHAQKRHRRQRVSVQQRKARVRTKLMARAKPKA